MDTLIWIGAAITLLGLAGLVYCILRVMQARRAKLGDDALRDAVRRVVPLQLGALFLSVIGLMLVVVGILLG